MTNILFGLYSPKDVVVVAYVIGFLADIHQFISHIMLSTLLLSKQEF
jgi:hypothetical protein